jgi:hypothetical protein
VPSAAKKSTRQCQRNPQPTAAEATPKFER